MKTYTEAELLDGIAWVREEIGRWPGTREWERYVESPSATYVAKRFGGSWLAAVAAAEHQDAQQAVDAEQAGVIAGLEAMLRREIRGARG